ncbi:MAG: NRDE family protein [Phycisphaerales bacterium]
MCTVTIVPGDGTGGGKSFRIVMNRDELRTRPIARPPRLRRCGSHQAIMPIDTDSGGTWIAVNDAGLAAMLLNVNAERDEGGEERDVGTKGLRDEVEEERDEGTEGLRDEVGSGSASFPSSLSPFVPSSLSSRGLIVPAIMGMASVNDAAGFAAAIDPMLYSPFRLVVTDGREVCDWRGDGRTMTGCERVMLRGPVMFTSSGLGDAMVRGPRSALFDKMFEVDAAEWREAQRAFHAHRWADQPELSVCMTRADASTVSVTQVDVSDERIVMRYVPVADQVMMEQRGGGISLRRAE